MSFFAFFSSSAKDNDKPGGSLSFLVFFSGAKNDDESRGSLSFLSYFPQVQKTTTSQDFDSSSSLIGLL